MIHKIRKTRLPSEIKLIIKLVSFVFDSEFRIALKTFHVMNDLRTKNGIVYMYKYMKAARLHITRYLCGKPLHANGAGVSVTRGGPTKFLFLRNLLPRHYTPRVQPSEGEMSLLRLILTLMTLSKGIAPSKAEIQQGLFLVDKSSITNEYTGKTYVIPRYFIDVMKRKYHVTGKLESPNSGNLFINMKSSPSGISIIASLGETLFHSTKAVLALTTLLGELGSSFFWKARDYATDKKGLGPFPEGIPSDRLDETDIVKSGKLTGLLESEGKMRVVASFDYWSQWALKPLHDDLLHILKRIPMDRTFDQNPFSSWKDDDNSYGSLDLSSATDRFPLFVQRKVIDAFYGREVGIAGETVLVEREFSDGGEEVKYAVGQPMGAYSSGPAFALCHHFVVQWAAHLCGFDNFEDYILLGDDIVIKNDRVARKYIALMTKGGVEISPNKTHVSKHTYEFAKRWIHHDSEISPLPIKGISRHFKEPKTVLSLVNDWHLKNHYLLGTGKSAFEVVKESYKGLKIKSQWVTNELVNKQLYDFGIGISYVKKNVLPSQLGEYFILNGWDVANLPNYDKIDDFTRRVVDLALSKVVSRINLKTWDLAAKLLKEFMPEVSDKNSVSWHPLIHALRNTIYNLKTKLMNYDSETQDLVEILDYLTVPGVSELVHLKRQLRKEVVGIDRLWKTIEVNSIVPEKNNISFFTGEPITDGSSLGGNKFLAMRAVSVGTLTRSVNDLNIGCSGGIVERQVWYPCYWETY